MAAGVIGVAAATRRRVGGAVIVGATAAALLDSPQLDGHFAVDGHASHTVDFYGNELAAALGWPGEQFEVVVFRGLLLLLLLLERFLSSTCRRRVRRRRLPPLLSAFAGRRRGQNGAGVAVVVEEESAVVQASVGGSTTPDGFGAPASGRLRKAELRGAIWRGCPALAWGDVCKHGCLGIVVCLCPATRLFEARHGEWRLGRAVPPHVDACHSAPAARSVQDGCHGGGGCEGCVLSWSGR